jgi:hypothetical protein
MEKLKVKFAKQLSWGEERGEMSRCKDGWKSMEEDRDLELRTCR